MDELHLHFVNPHLDSPAIAALRTPTTWFHSPLEDAALRSGALKVCPGPGVGDLLATWLCEEGGRVCAAVELQAGTRTPGVWVAAAGVGATAARAARNGARVTRHLSLGLAGFGWPAIRRDHPGRLPVRAALEAPEQLSEASHLPSALGALARLAQVAGPTALRFTFDLHRTKPDLLRESQRALRAARAVAQSAQFDSPFRFDRRLAADDAVRRITRIRDEAADVGVRVTLHCGTVPGLLPRRALADALSIDLACDARWVTDPVPPRVRAGLGLVAGAMELASAVEAPVEEEPDQDGSGGVERMWIPML